MGGGDGSSGPSQLRGACAGVCWGTPPDCSPTPESESNPDEGFPSHSQGVEVGNVGFFTLELIHCTSKPGRLRLRGPRLVVVLISPAPATPDGKTRCHANSKYKVKYNKGPCSCLIIVPSHCHPNTAYRGPGDQLILEEKSRQPSLMRFMCTSQPSLFDLRYCPSLSARSSRSAAPRMTSSNP
jgi:hypothetical protein